MTLSTAAGAQHRARIEIVPHLDHTGLVLAAAFSTDGALFLSGGEDATLKLWDGATLRLIRNFVGHSGAVVAVAFSRDGTRVLSGSRDGTMRLWETATGQPLLTIRPAGRIRDTATTVWDAATGRPLFTIPPSNDLSRTLGVSSVAFSPDGKHLLLGTEHGSAMLWEAASGRLVQTFEHAKLAFGRTSRSPSRPMAPAC